MGTPAVKLQQTVGMCEGASTTPRLSPRERSGAKCPLPLLLEFLHLQRGDELGVMGEDDKKGQRGKASDGAHGRHSGPEVAGGRRCIRSFCPGGCAGRVVLAQP